MCVKYMWKSRKDSFITHRAFCDALTEENSRMASFPIMSSTPNLNFRHDLMMMNGGGGGLRYTGMFGGGMLESTNLDTSVAKPRLPIWLDQNGNESHLENPSNSSFLGSSSSINNNNGGMLPSEMVQYWLKEEEENKGDQMQFSSLYNNYTTSTTQQPPLLPPPPVDMSATALLQKAAQMGSTRSTNPGDTTGFGLMSPSLSNFSNSLNNDSTSDGLMMMMNLTASKQTKTNESLHDANLTRDFLGVGGNERRPFSLQQQNLFNFTSSSMDNSST